MQNHLFNAVDPSSTFNDLVAFNIQRARDHGIPDWNTCRGQLGLTVFSSFNDSRLKLEMSAANIDLLYSIYGANGINDTDPFVGGLAEAHVAGAAMGRSFYTAIYRQFLRLRNGDRNYFDSAASPNPFTSAEMDAIRKTQLVDVVLRNTAIAAAAMPRFTFKVGGGARRRGALRVAACMAAVSGAAGALTVQQCPPPLLRPPQVISSTNPVLAGASAAAKLYGTVVNGSASSVLGAKLAWSIPVYNADCSAISNPMATFRVTCPGVGWCGIGVGAVHSAMDVYLAYKVLK